MKIYKRAVMAERLKLQREKLGLSQLELSRLAKVSSNSIWHYECKDVLRNPSLDTLAKLSKTFNVSVDYLMGLTNNERINE